MESFNRDHIIDTNVLLYFMLVDEADLLAKLLGEPLQVPLAVYDPYDTDPSRGAQRTEALSEIRQYVNYHENRSQRKGAVNYASRLRQVDRLYELGRIRTVSLDQSEKHLSDVLLSREQSRQRGIPVGLGPGEAACVAIATKRGWTIATDDNKALRVMEHLNPEAGFRYERIRRLLKRAAVERYISQMEANNLHREMVNTGFRDNVPPFPNL